jgi:hypothetical protein
METLVTGGRKWERIPISNGGKVKWASDCHNYEIFKTKTGRYRLVAFEHEPSQQFPDAGFWMREYATLEQAAEQAEVM